MIKNAFNATGNRYTCQIYTIIECIRIYICNTIWNY